jgi:endonuclease-3
MVRYPMPDHDRQRWLRRHSGPASARRMSAALARIASTLEHDSARAAVTRIALSRDPFAILVSCIISLRTKDEVTDVASARLLGVAPTADVLARLEESRIAKLIYPAGFYRTKARTLRDLARTLRDRYGGAVPGTLDELLELRGVGRKTANLVVTLGFDAPGICVDTHVHRISNRLGFVRTEAPDDSERVLRARLPKRWWIPINDLLVTHGRNVCTPLSPRCSECVAADLCPRIGVGRSR